MTEINADPPSISRHRPVPRLSSSGLTMALLLVCLLPLSGLTIYAVVADRAADKSLPVRVDFGKRPVEVPGGEAAIVTDVLILTNLANFSIPRITIDINGQYFLHRDAPLEIGEELVLPQQIFSTKSNQRWVPGRYPITEINVTGQLPSKARGVLKIEYDADGKPIELTQTE